MSKITLSIVSKVFVDLATGHFNSDEARRYIDKLEFTPENNLKILLGLRVVGFTLYSGQGQVFLFRYLIENTEYSHNQIAELQRNSYMVESLKALKNSVQISDNAFGGMWNSYLRSISEDIRQGIENPEYIWGENEHGGLKMGGVLGVVLRRVFKTQSISEIFTYSDLDGFLDIYMEATLYFDSIFKACFSGLEADITEILHYIREQ